MKKSILILFVFVGFALSAQNTKVEVLKEFLKGTIQLDAGNIDLGQPIFTINELATSKADKVADLTKENVAEVLAEAKNYSTCIITVGVHTIVKVTDFEDCSPSGAWGACMPMGKGYIQKAGVLSEVNDYLKNIIGRPGSQERKVFLFK
ncbi:hypothetical protein GQR60_13510 [Labilibaculum sp. A4]|uniref:hypothetical protein n=1 Tax=Labilibaculum euxinus TaxID=2686357 RepID=UPI000F61BEBC|nr:hypothetical protein [Labilibaculum euxinus]MDQ1771653.1 hypothetical protein [Labilibaculum euxinus]MWN77358.1 hypothetical protein [Labilibaculum euxinus]